jgi:DNA-binding transcriptional regulator YhcF (GntR family)
LFFRRPNPTIFGLVDYGFSLTERAIYGQIWRYSQFSEGHCTVTMETFAKNIGVSKKTIVRALARLEERGWVINLTPQLKNQSHTRIVRIQEIKLKKESHHHDDEPSFSENQSIAAEISTWIGYVHPFLVGAPHRLKIPIFGD